MNSNSKKRLTQLGPGFLGGHEPSPQTSAPRNLQAKQRAVSGNLPTLNSGGVGTRVVKGARSAATDYPDAPSCKAEAYHAVSRGSPWRSYEKIYEL